MRRAWIRLALVFVGVSQAYALPPESSLAIGSKSFSYFASHDLNQPNPAIERLIVVVHGSERNANTYYNSIERVANEAGLGASTLIVSPHFYNADDAASPNALRFDDEGWLRGDGALNDPRVSAFDVIDRFVETATQARLFPNLRSITITGHSAGGQLTQRYAASSLAEAAHPGVRFRYLVLNPGSYVYLTPKRITERGTFEVPGRPRCRYDDYKYGTQNVNTYWNRAPLAQHISAYVARDVHYLLGELDNTSADIDQDCPAQYQGDTRLHRGQTFKAYMDAEFPGNTHRLVVIPGVAHTQYGMYLSELGRKELFP